MAAMRTFSRLLLLTAVAVLGQRTIFGLGAPTSNVFPLGTIGCMLSDVCPPGQHCKDDQLFGSCESRVSRRDFSAGGEYEFQLSVQQLEELEEEIWKLIRTGFTWKDAYTQCSLQNMLLSFAQGEVFDSGWCKQALSEPDYQGEYLQDDIATVLKKLMELQGGRLQDGFGTDSLIPNSIKRDEFVDIHKYFDRSKGQYKRDPYLDDEASFRNYLTPLGVSDSSDGDLAHLQDVSQPMESSEYREQEDPDSESIQQYLQTLEQIADGASNEDTAYGNFGPTDYVEETVGPDAIIKEERPEDDMSYLPFGQAPIETEMTREQEQAPSNEGSNPLDKSDSADEESPGQTVEAGGDVVAAVEEAPVNTDDADKTDNVMSISPPDENTLEELLEGKLEAKNLDDGQLKRLTKYIEAMVDTLEEPPEETDVLEAEEKPLTEEAENVLDQSEALVEQPIKNEFPVDKKAALDGDPEGSPDGSDEPKPNEFVKTRYVNLALTPQVPSDQLVKFVMNLSKIIGLNASAVDDIQLHDGKVVFEVKPNPYMNASDVVDKINTNDVRGKLLELTGFELTNDGIGKEKQVELKKDRYVVLTFILVGSIAGILLAVIVIYVVKRHSLSRKKLAQLSATGETNEASKDYQDLCRQRMQSKSSEKPEPLHAASRIGSVSESQVRSPSSRSSTSSWSEEPVTSNMDISTGHIVLSYMEDHLKNQNRLDQEWEALCSYEADPCATVVAADASNTRKNRYGDILPYDHSRVVISTAANVSGSDYVNANFITDHDPRNPAFISTQGPLPHTVADFWQMVWEQGSVVIVMLTKLTENGTAMCHRYWPEEGSDLYHIYEVHLVSEHIWCDDYLVRSFYLKNLQTNETRTVTQFHFLTWPNLAVPGSIKTLLDFRRKVNKSYRGRSCPIVVHCSDGCGRTGTYCLIDMVLNRLAKGAKEIDMAATLEHIRDQRMAMVKTKEQFQFSLAAVAEEVHAILKALPQ